MFELRLHPSILISKIDQFQKHLQTHCIGGLTPTCTTTPEQERRAMSLHDDTGRSNVVGLGRGQRSLCRSTSAPRCGGFRSFVHLSRQRVSRVGSELGDTVACNSVFRSCRRKAKLRQIQEATGLHLQWARKNMVEATSTRQYVINALMI